jgi:cell wall-associated NlpC family hydrolase
VTSGWFEPRHRVRRGLAVSIAATALAAAIVAGPHPTAVAEPAPQNVAQAKAQVEKLQHEAEAADQEYLGLKEKLDESKDDLKEREADLEEQTEKVEEMRDRVSAVALAQFQNRDLDARTRLFLTRDPEGFLNQMATVEKVSQNQNSVLQDYQVEQANLADMQRSNKAYVATLEEDQKKLAELREEADEKVQKAEDVLAELSEEERQAIEAEQQRQADEAEQAAEDAGLTADDPTVDDSTGDTDDGSSADVAGSGKGAEVVAFAKAALGKPYAFGATGPGSYDCSGLTLSAWQSAGVQLDRTSQAQFGNGTAVDRSELQPGDLVFFYGPSPSHVGIYVGNDSMIHAPRPGKSVEYSKISYMPYAGARRPG